MCTSNYVHFFFCRLTELHCLKKYSSQTFQHFRVTHLLFIFEESDTVHGFIKYRNIIYIYIYIYNEYVQNYFMLKFRKTCNSVQYITKVFKRKQQMISIKRLRTQSDSRFCNMCTEWEIIAKIDTKYQGTMGNIAIVFLMQLFPHDAMQPHTMRSYTIHVYPFVSAEHRRTA